MVRFEFVVVVVFRFGVVVGFEFAMDIKVVIRSIYETVGFILWSRRRVDGILSSGI